MCSAGRGGSLPGDVALSCNPSYSGGQSSGMASHIFWIRVYMTGAENGERCTLTVQQVWFGAVSTSQNHDDLKLSTFLVRLTYFNHHCV
jgi:hypothetical protein